MSHERRSPCPSSPRPSLPPFAMASARQGLRCIYLHVENLHSNHRKENASYRASPFLLIELMVLFIIYFRIQKSIEKEFVSTMGLSSELTGEAEKNDVSFFVLSIDYCGFACNHIFS